jgi:hypothetical protein
MKRLEKVERAHIDLLNRLECLRLEVPTSIADNIIKSFNTYHNATMEWIKYTIIENKPEENDETNNLTTKGK